jgi:uncharacterized protein with HEPN domain
MPPRKKAPLFDIAQAALGIAQFVEDKTIQDYKSDLMLRSAVERQLSIIGEAINRLRKDNPGQAGQISDIERITSFRNVLIHAYDQVDHKMTWEIVHEKLPILAREVEALLKEGKSQ